LKRGPLAGALTAVVTGGVMSFLVTIAGEAPSGFIEAILTLTIPLLAAGILFGWLMDIGHLHSFPSAILYWAVAFSASRLVQELMVGERPIKDGPIGFVIYQAIVGLLFGLGVMLLYQQVLAGFRKLRGEPAAPEPDGGEAHG
jgi:hypothetical protein